MIGTTSHPLPGQLRFDGIAEPEGNELAGSINEAIRLCDHYTGRAERALRDGDTEAAQDLLRSAINELEEVATARSDA